MKKHKTTIIWVIVVIVAFLGGMYAGRLTVRARASFAAFGAASSTRAGFGGGARGAGGGFVAGTVSSIDSQSITLTLPNGNSEIVFYSSSTSIIKPSPASISDLSAGTMVMIGGTSNSDGSLTAQSIQVRNMNGR